jgi:hypothetical protein
MIRTDPLSAPRRSLLGSLSAGQKGREHEADQLTTYKAHSGTPGAYLHLTECLENTKLNFLLIQSLRIRVVLPSFNAHFTTRGAIFACNRKLKIPERL